LIISYGWIVSEASSGCVHNVTHHWIFGYQLIGKLSNGVPVSPQRKILEQLLVEKINQ